MESYFFLLVVLPVSGLILLLTEWVLRQYLKTSWLPLATAYPLIGPVAGPQTTLGWVSVGGSGLVGNKNLVRAGVTAAGLSLRLPLLAWLHPPMRIPWVACGPFRAEKRLLWVTRYSTLIRLPDGALIPLRFEDGDFGRMLRPWVRVEEA